MRTPQERRDHPLGDIPHNDPRPWRREVPFGADRPGASQIPFGAESEMRRIPIPPAAPPSPRGPDVSFWSGSGPRRNWAIVAGASAAAVAAGLATPLLVAGAIGALATLLTWDGLRLAGKFSDHSYDGSVWDAQGNLILAKKNGVIVWTKDLGTPPPAGIPRKI